MFSLTHVDMLFKHEQFDFSNVSIEDNQIKFNVSSLFITQRTIGQISGKLGRISSLKFDQEGVHYHRLIIPTNTKINFTFSVENVIIEYIYEKQISTRNAIEINLEGHNFLLYQAAKKLNDDNKDNYIVLESASPIVFEQFTEMCYSILIGFGFVSGSFIQNEGFFFQYKESTLTAPTAFCHSVLRDSINCSYVPTYSNPHGYIHNPEIAERYKDKPRTLKLSEFSSLCSRIFNIDDFKSIILLILESNTQSLVSSPGTLSIALETISNVIYNENETALAPISDQRIAKEVKSHLKKEVLKFTDNISQEGIDIITSRIDNINQRTNREKLLLPFKILKIDINEKDISAIEQRNAFLHGNTPMILNEKPHSLRDEDKFRYYLYLKLYTLISALILKYCGFDNLILNYPKIYELETGINLNEEHYRKV
jgi:hypothetical protein